MTKRTNTRILKSIFGTIFKEAPFSAAVASINHGAIAFMPALATFLSIGMFDSAARVLAGEDTKSALYFYSLTYLGTYLFNDLLALLSGVAVNAGVYEKSVSRFRILLFEKAAKLPLICFEDAKVLDKRERAERSIADETFPSIFMRCLSLLSSFLAIISVMSVLAGYSWYLLPISLLSVLPYLFARMVRGKEFYHVKRQQAKKNRQLHYLWGLFSSRRPAKEMRVMGFDGYLTDRWAAVRDEVNEELWKQSTKDNKTLLLCDGIRIIGYGLSIGVVLWLCVGGNVSVGVFGGCLTAFLNVQGSMKEFLVSLGRLPEYLGYAGDYYEFLDLPEEHSGGAVFDGLREGISVNGVSFSYPNADTLAVDKVTFHIKKGEKVAILGENGSGKTTIAKLLLGLYPAKTGEITYDGLGINGFERESFFQKVSIIQQNFVPYQLSVGENVALSEAARPANTPRIQTALKEAGLEELAKMGLNASLGREFGGMELSGGQWQKLAIARGMYKESELIILDEPTSALDPLIETEILQNFIRAAEAKTAVMISHRVGLCRLVDKIIVMKEGKIAEIGGHVELLARGGEYARLYTAQQKWYV